MRVWPDPLGPCRRPPRPRRVAGNCKSDIRGHRRARRRQGARAARILGAGSTGNSAKPAWCRAGTGRGRSRRPPAAFGGAVLAFARVVRRHGRRGGQHAAGIRGDRRYGPARLTALRRGAKQTGLRVRRLQDKRIAFIQLAQQRRQIGAGSHGRPPGSGPPGVRRSSASESRRCALAVEYPDSAKGGSASGHP